MPVVIVLLVLIVLAELFLLMLRCRREHPGWKLLRQYRYAHRGYHDKPHIPENSMAAFRRAIEHGYGAELDVHLMKDGRLAVIHDASLKRTAGADVLVMDSAHGHSVNILRAIEMIRGSFPSARRESGRYRRDTATSCHPF